ncbi:hypothetical protein ACQ4PT_015154 [Festuca glaucescens]
MSHDDPGAPPPAAAKKKSPAEEAAEKRREKLTPGSLMKAVIRSGSGDATPTDGDQVILHCTTRTMDGIVVNSTRREHGGKGIPLRFVLGRSKMILGFAEGFPTMLKGEIAMVLLFNRVPVANFKMEPKIHYAEDDCPVATPDGFPKDDELQFEIEMLDFFKAKVISEDFEVVKKVPKGLEMGIGSMARKEKATIYVSSTYLTESSLMPQLEGLEEVHFEVELVQFTQDWTGLNFKEIMEEADKIKNTISMLNEF